MLLIRLCLDGSLLRHRLPKCFRLLNDHILDGAELFLLYQWLMGRRVPSVVTGDLILQPPPLVLALSHGVVVDMVELLILMVIPLVSHGHTLFHQPPAALGVDTHRRRNNRHITAEHTTHVVE